MVPDPDVNDDFDVYATLGTPYSGFKLGDHRHGGSQRRQAESATTVEPILLDSGGTVDCQGLPAGAALTVTGGTTLDLEGTSRVLGIVTLAGGTITDGSIDASSYNLENGEIDANLSGGPVTMTGDGYVALTGGNTYTGGTTIAGGGTLAVGSNALSSGTVAFSAAGTLQALGDLSLSASQPIVTSSVVTIDTNGYNASLSGGVKRPR